jgi:membrane protease YdiL (CAAX protease family)
MVSPVRVAAAYLLLGTFSFTVAVLWRGSSPFSYPDPWLSLDPTSSHGLSIVLGLAFGALLVGLTRFFVPRFGWAKALHSSLRPFARGMTSAAIAVVAVLSALGEELLFRGLLQPGLGIFVQAALFGVAHQLPGPSRWVWVAWATLTGLALGAVFQLTGSLLGPIFAHALVNGMNLSYLRAHDPEGRRALGGLLGGAGPGAARLR